jgi:cation-dependent mannose-6-phosphate receptor
LLIAVLTWFLGHTLYNRFFLKLRGRDQFPIPSVPSLHLPSMPSLGKSGSAASAAKPNWGWQRRSQRAGYGHVRAEEDDEEEGFAGRFSLEDEDEDAEDLTGQGLDARALGGNAGVWRDTPAREEEGRVGVHQGLVDI